MQWNFFAQITIYIFREFGLKTWQNFFLSHILEKSNNLTNLSSPAHYLKQLPRVVPDTSYPLFLYW